MAEIVPVVSETLEAQIRNLLPSQRGFGEDLQASNVIMPTIDLTPAAEGTNVPLYQQQAIAFGSQTTFSSNGTTDVVANTPGFYRIIGTATARTSGTADVRASFTMSDGISTKTVWRLALDTATTGTTVSENIDFTVFLASGESISAVTDSDNCYITGSSRQTADVNGNSVNPSGFNPQ